MEQFKPDSEVEVQLWHIKVRKEEVWLALTLRRSLGPTTTRNMSMLSSSSSRRYLIVDTFDDYSSYTR